VGANSKDVTCASRLVADNLVSRKTQRADLRTNCGRVSDVDRRVSDVDRLPVGEGNGRCRRPIAVQGLIDRGVGGRTIDEVDVVVARTGRDVDRGDAGLGTSLERNGPGAVQPLDDQGVHVPSARTAPSIVLSLRAVRLVLRQLCSEPPPLV
jgi:hypothetical protein